MPHLTTPAGVTWHYDVEGEGNNILFLHGWGASSRIWRQQTKYFSQSYRVCSIDLPGHGKSSWRPMTLDEMAEDIAGILKHAGFQQTTIVARNFSKKIGRRRRGLCSWKLSNCHRFLLYFSEILWDVFYLVLHFLYIDSQPLGSSRGFLRESYEASQQR